ncbi:MAG: hypothetical protein V5B38_17385 [Candidatus Accumulibacter propinquus]|jgi:hypothetical protein
MERPREEWLETFHEETFALAEERLVVNALPRQDHLPSRERLRQQVASPQAFASLSRQQRFIASDSRQGFTRPSFGSPRLPRLLMHCTYKRHGCRLSFSFGPSLHAGSYYGLC